MNDVVGNYQKDNNTTFVTTAIDYPNAMPHIGTAFEKIGADVFARFRRFQGRDVYFTMGNDENTVKVLKAANNNTQEYVDEMAKAFQLVWQNLDISNDDFIQTTEERHRIGVQLFLNAVHKAGYIEKRAYKALYCEGCEEYKTPNSLLHGRCPNHFAPLIEREEENWFFLLSKFKQKILDLILPTPFLTAFLSIEPESRYNELKKFVEAELEDISISRKNTGWGIPIPWDATQVTYVWFDALLNYLTVIGFGTDWNKFEKYWPAEVHFIGKDITRFHCALFPAMCMAYNEGSEEHRLKAYPKRVFAHGFVYQRKGNQVVKASKSGDAISPMELVNQFGSDSYRYYFLSKFNYDGDGEYSLEHFKEVYNSDLANALGNLLSRTAGMILQYAGGRLLGDETTKVWLNEKMLEEYESLISNCGYKPALELVWKIIADANKYIDETKPWELAKSDKANKVLLELVSCLRIVGLLLKPFLPKVAEKIYASFNWEEGWNEVNWGLLQKLAKNNYLGVELGVDVNRHVLTDAGKYPQLFPRLK
jgi:methionyl-tRNA synthetase